MLGSWRDVQGEAYFLEQGATPAARAAGGYRSSRPELLNFRYRLVGVEGRLLGRRTFPLLDGSIPDF